MLSVPWCAFGHKATRLSEPGRRPVPGALTVVAVPALLGPEAQAQCRPADSTSTLLVRELTRIATGIEPADQRVREIAKIARVAANPVSLITNKTVCKTYGLLASTGL